MQNRVFISAGPDLLRKLGFIDRLAGSDIAGLVNRFSARQDNGCDKKAIILFRIVYPNILGGCPHLYRHFFKARYGDIAGAIAEALVTTAAGLFVAIPSMIFSNYFTRLVNKEIVILESSVTEVVLKLTGHLL